MTDVLILAGAAVLLVLIVVSAVRQLQIRTEKKDAVARAYTGEAAAQHEESLARRAEVRAAHAARTEGTPAGLGATADE
jgi:hypothetical protein